MSRILRCCLVVVIFMGAVFAASVALVGGLLWMIFQVPGLPGGVERVPVSEEAVESFEQKLEYSAKAAEEGVAVTVSFSEEELTSIVAKFLEESADDPQAPPVRDPQVRIVDGKVEVSGVVDNPLDLPLVGDETRIRILLSLDVSEGVATWSVEALDVGRVGVPGRVRDVAVRLIQLATRSEGLELPKEISSIRIEGDRLIVETSGE